MVGSASQCVAVHRSVLQCDAHTQVIAVCDSVGKL